MSSGQDPSVSGVPELSIPYPEEHVVHMLFEHDWSEQLSGHLFLPDFIKKYTPTPRAMRIKNTMSMIAASTIYLIAEKIPLHEIRNDRGVVPDVLVLGVRGVCAEVVVSVADGTADRLGPPNLLTRVEEVLPLENIAGGELSVVLLGSNLTGHQR